MHFAGVPSEIAVRQKSEHTESLLSLKEDEYPVSLLNAAVAGTCASGVILGLPLRSLNQRSLRESASCGVTDTSATFFFFQYTSSRRNEYGSDSLKLIVKTPAK